MKAFLQILFCVTRFAPIAGLVASCQGAPKAESPPPVDFGAIRSPIIFAGDEKWAYRDPAAVYHNETFYLYFTVSEMDGQYFYNRIAMSTSRDLLHWSKPRFLTPRDQNLNYSSPGNVIGFGGRWALCLQTYPTPEAGQSTGDASSRLWIMRSDDLENWSEPELLRVKGPDVPVEAMGRMIDPYLIEDAADPGKWWCFYKQNGVSMSWSRDLKTWTYVSKRRAGENVTVLRVGDEYLMLHSPRNGVGVKRSKTLDDWSEDGGMVYLGQENWPWAKERLTAATALDLTKEPGIARYVIFFHGESQRKTVPGTHGCASLGIAWTRDFKAWEWPGKLSQKSGESTQERKNEHQAH